MTKSNTPLRKLRIEKKITIHTVARAIGWDVGNLSRVERGLQVADIERAKKIRAFFNDEITVMEIMYPFSDDG